MSQEGLPATLDQLRKNLLLRDCVKASLAVCGTPKKRISRDLSDRYIERAYEIARRDHAHAMPSEETALCEILCPIIQTLVANDERMLLDLLESTNWPSLTKKLLALTIHRHGSRINRYGASADDYVQEAVALLLARRRHYPVDRKDLTLFTFLARTIDNLFDHASDKTCRDGEPLRIVSDVEAPATDEVVEEHLRLEVSDREREMIAADYARRFVSWLGDDVPLQAYAQLRVYEFCGSSAAYAAELDTTVGDIRNRERRFRRRLREYAALQGR